MPSVPKIDVHGAQLAEWYNDEFKVTKPVQVDDAARRCLRFKKRYQAVEKTTGVPWKWIAVAHLRESNNNFAGVLHNGEHILGTGRKTRLVPRGRGPFQSWEEAALDALKLKKLVGLPAATWTLAFQLYKLEEFNGWGYYWKGKRSAYVWGGTSLQQPGKYVADHKWSNTHRDTQLGVAPVMKRIEELEGVTTVPTGKIATKARGLRRSVEAVGGAVMVWLGQFYDNMTLDNMIAYATDPKTLALVGGGLVLWLGLKSLDDNVIKAYKQGNYYTNDELEADDAELAD